MSDSIILDITEVVERQKKSKSYNIKLAILIVGVLIFSSVTVAGMYNIPNLLFLGPAVLVGIITAFIYNIPDSAERKFLKPFVDNIYSQLGGQNYSFDDKKGKKGLKPWFSGSSGYLYGKGLTIAKDASKGLDARKIEFKHGVKGSVFLSVERLSSADTIFLQVVELDADGDAVMLDLVENDFGLPVVEVAPVVSKLPPSAFRDVSTPVANPGAPRIVLPPPPPKI